MQITPLLELMKEILTGGSHRHCAGDVCNALSHMSDGGDEASQIVFNLGVCPSMLKIYEELVLVCLDGSLVLSRWHPGIV